MSEEKLLEQDIQLAEEQKQELKKIISKESRSGRKLKGIWHIIASILGLIMVLLYFYSSGIRPISAQYNRGIYVLITYVMIFLYFPFWRKSNQERPTFFDICLALLAAFCVGYWMLEFENLNYRAGVYTQLDFIVSIIGILLSLEVCRRVLGWSMTLCGIFFLIYGLYGRYFPSLFAHRGFSLERLSTVLFLEQNGIFGVMANVLVTYVILFIFFGSFLQKSGVGKFFIEWPLALAGKTVAGQPRFR